MCPAHCHLSLAILRAMSVRYLGSHLHVQEVLLFLRRVEIVIHAGSVNRNTPRVVTQARDTFRPPGYEDALQPITQPNDISLIRFSQDLNFNSELIFKLNFLTRIFWRLMGVVDYIHTKNFSSDVLIVTA